MTEMVPFHYKKN